MTSLHIERKTKTIRNVLHRDKALNKLCSPVPVDLSTNTPSLKSQGTLQKREQKDFKSPRIREFAEILLPSNTKRYTHEVSPRQLPKCELNKDDNEHTKLDEEKPMRLTKNYKQPRKAGNRRSGPP